MAVRHRARARADTSAAVRASNESALTQNPPLAPSSELSDSPGPSATCKEEEEEEEEGEGEGEDTSPVSIAEK